MTTTLGRSDQIVLDSATVHGSTVQLRRIIEHRTSSTAYLVTVSNGDRTARANFSGYHAASAAFDRLTKK